MLSKPAFSSVNLNALAKMVSNAGFQRIMFDEDFKQYGRQMKRLLKKNGVVCAEKCSFKEIIDISYTHLLDHYRHEYLYKTSLLNSYVLKNYSLTDTVLLNEFKVGNSKADMVLVNGTNKVFEIKTELDSPERLNSQINDYYKAFSEVYIVIHHSTINKYANLLDECVGIMTFNQNNIEVLRTAQSDQTRLDITIMMKSLRKDEYLALVRNLSGFVPKVQPVLLFKSCLQVLSEYAVDEVQFEYLKVIKQRINTSTNELVVEPNLPDSLRFSCYNSNLNENDYLSLIKRLNYRF